ncbi:hypothetical protein Mycsm_05273 [Mycobacterium sp. JS623]|uniref:hypothetical protein n=1 Tax=Mycobacterium sp. JS623 TaxID=212767 RepID=UPI0002A566C1|nr:hypothetical protein [Mycobacterium sp. JS623]AGB25471.1 hypothetical protein Mycsm_05273 [Mycobacterium sp. JS623]
MTTDGTDRRTAPGSPEASNVEMDAPGQSRDTSKHPQRLMRRTTLQERLEESRVGKRVISAVILVILGVQVVWSMPESAIRRDLMPLVEPANVINVNERWSMFAPNIGQRVENFEVQVTMADGTTRVWRVEPAARLEKIFWPSRLPLMTETAMRQQDGRKELARWIVRQLTGPSERPVKVVMMFHFRVLPPPGESSKNPTGTKVIYEEALTGQR